jgi:hypothetical protein
MWNRGIPFLALPILFLIATTVTAQQMPVDVSACELAKQPKSFDGKIIRVRSELNVFFEDFSLGYKDCGADHGIWLAFGGDVPGVVASTVNDDLRKPGVDLRVNGVAYEVKKDENFRKLYALIAARRGDKPEYRVTATLTGAFLAGVEGKRPNGNTYFSGYGHLGCCSLLIITQVAAVESVPPARLDLSGVVRGPDGRPMEGVVVFDDVLGGSPPQRQQAVTNGEGEFHFSDSGRKLRIQNPKYRPLGLDVEPGAAPIRLKLQDATRSDWIVSPCNEADAAGRIGFFAFYAIPKTMTSSPFENDGERSLFVFPQSGESVDAELILSDDAEDTLTPESRDSRWIKDTAGAVIGMDSRWRGPHGYFWRRISFLGHDSAGYSTKSSAHRDSLNRILDSACTARQ